MVLTKLKAKSIHHFSHSYMFAIFPSVQVSEDPDLGKDPDHRAGLTLYALEGRVDYMGSSVLMTRLSSLDVFLHDEWHVEKDFVQDTPVATNRLFLAFSGLLLILCSYISGI